MGTGNLVEHCEVSPYSSDATSSAHGEGFGRLEMPSFDLLRTAVAQASPFLAPQLFDEMPNRASAHEDASDYNLRSMDSLLYGTAPLVLSPLTRSLLVVKGSSAQQAQAEPNLANFNRPTLCEEGTSKVTEGTEVESYITPTPWRMPDSLGPVSDRAPCPSSEAVSLPKPVCQQPLLSVLQATTFCPDGPTSHTKDTTLMGIFFHPGCETPLAVVGLPRSALEISQSTDAIAAVQPKLSTIAFPPLPSNPGGQSSGIALSPPPPSGEVWNKDKMVKLASLSGPAKSHDASSRPS